MLARLLLLSDFCMDELCPGFAAANSIRPSPPLSKGILPKDRQSFPFSWAIWAVLKRESLC